MYPDDSLTLHTDLYQINMMQVYFDQGIHNKHAVFEVYFRQQPFKNGYAVFAVITKTAIGANNPFFKPKESYEKRGRPGGTVTGYDLYCVSDL